MRKEPQDLVLTLARNLAVFYFGSDQVDQLYDMLKVDISFLAESDKKVWIVHNRRKIDPALLEWVENNTRLIDVLDVPIGVENKEMRIYHYDPETHY